MINILYDSKEFVVCEKPSGLVSEYSGNASSSLPAILGEQLGGQNLYTVHRLDKEVSGAIVYAKTQEAASELSKQITNGNFKKEYIAVVTGKLPEDEARLCDLLFHDRQKNKTFVVKKKRAGVKEAILEYKLLSYDENENLSTLKIRLFTGRTHQIRVQLASRGFPICGDRKYGSQKHVKPIKLHSYSLSFNDYTNQGETLSFLSDPIW